MGIYIKKGRDQERKSDGKIKYFMFLIFKISKI